MMMPKEVGAGTFRRQREIRELVERIDRRGMKVQSRENEIHGGRK